jgi:hypothetical protein
LPWFIETTMVTPGRDVVVHSKGNICNPRANIHSSCLRLTFNLIEKKRSKLYLEDRPYISLKLSRAQS